MLADNGIISQDDKQAILEGLAQIQAEIDNGQFTFLESLEDIHMNVETRLAELIGDAARRLHTARSRNDQVATDIRLWLRARLDEIDTALAHLQTALLTQAERYAETLMPGFTHLQTAQPVTFGFHLMAYVEMIGRDRGRFADCRKRVNESPLGAAALLVHLSLLIDIKQQNCLALINRWKMQWMQCHRVIALLNLWRQLRFVRRIFSSCRRDCDLVNRSICLYPAIRCLHNRFIYHAAKKRNPDAAELVRQTRGGLWAI